MEAEKRNTMRAPTHPQDCGSELRPRTFEETVFEGLGEASMSWDRVPEGIFDATKCKAIGENIMRAHRDEMVMVRKQGFRDGQRYQNS